MLNLSMNDLERLRAGEALDQGNGWFLALEELTSERCFLTLARRGQEHWAIHAESEDQPSDFFALASAIRILGARCYALRTCAHSGNPPVLQEGKRNHWTVAPPGLPVYGQNFYREDLRETFINRCTQRMLLWASLPTPPDWAAEADTMWYGKPSKEEN